MRGVVAGVIVAFALVTAGPVFSAQVEVGAQKESDWVDARWNATDLGNFHASLVGTPSGIVTKGLSIRVGEQTNTILYDTATASVRAIWSDGFLEFEPARYGLLRTPHPAGDYWLVPPKTPAWSEPVRWRGLHVDGPHVVLEYEVGSTRVLETPWAEKSGEITTVTRTFLFSKESNAALTLADGKNATLSTNDGLNCASLTTKLGPVAFTFKGDGATFVVESNSLRLQFSVKANAPLKLFAAPIPASQLASLVKKSAAAEDVVALAKAGAPRWKPLTTRGQRGFGNDAFVIDTLTMPYDNPWKALMFGSGVDFLPNGDALVCTLHGDVWLVSGIDDSLQKLTWRRYATGLFQPLGLRVRDGKVFVLCRDHIVRLHDENGDGEADFYESFFSGIKTSSNGHDFVTSLETDTNGNFYYVDPIGAHRVMRDGSHEELIAAGFRNPNGMGVSPNGKIVTVAPQQGEWTPSSVLIETRNEGWYGYGGPKVTDARPLGYDGPLCWIPHNIDNSSGSQLWITGEKWKPLAGHMLHFGWGKCNELLVLREVVDGVAQGAVVQLPGKFISGPMRGAFHPKDGQLYVAGSTGWQTAAARDGCLQRVRFTGKDPQLPIESHIHANGIRLTFTTALDRSAAEDAGSYSFSQWNYLYSKNYGSKDYLPSDPQKEGHETVEVISAKLSADGKTIFLEIPGLKPVMQFEVKYSLNSADGKALRNSVWGTINRLGPKF